MEFAARSMNSRSSSLERLPCGWSISTKSRLCAAVPAGRSYPKRQQVPREPTIVTTATGASNGSFARLGIAPKVGLRLNDYL